VRLAKDEISGSFLLGLSNPWAKAAPTLGHDTDVVPKDYVVSESDNLIASAVF